jgi:hypothetical protein
MTTPPTALAGASQATTAVTDAWDRDCMEAG